MIVKLTRVGELARYHEAETVFRQPLANGRVDIEITKPSGNTLRVVIGEDADNEAYPDLWNRAYVMEHGKTVDTIRGHGMPQGAIK